MDIHESHGRSSRDWLDRALQDLPRESPSPEFTGKVLQRVRQERMPRRPAPRRLAMAAAAAVVLALAVPVALRMLTADPAADRRASIEELLREQQRLAADLASVRDSMERASPRIYLGGDDSVDLVLDLGQVARRRYGAGPNAGWRSEGVMPASADGRRR